MKNIGILGSTGSIGRSTLDIIRQHPDEFKVQMLVTNRNIDLFAEQIAEFKPEYSVVYDEQAYTKFKNQYHFPDSKLWHGQEGVHRVFSEKKPDHLVNAFVGFAGLEPTITAVMRGIPVALANKESLVVAGSLVMQLAEKNNVEIFPIDSEHSAIWQCLAGENHSQINRLIITASGGPFRTVKKENLELVTPEEALNHPNWKMGPKITIDSATLMNKGLEVIEAYWLYKVPVERLEVLIHPQSIIHSMVEFTDKSIKAQLGMPDMRLPIQYALSYPKRFLLDMPAMDFTQVTALTFEQPDYLKFPCLGLAFSALKKGGSYTAVLNAANEAAVTAFLDRRIRFTQIASVIEKLLETHQRVEATQFGDFLEIDKITRIEAEKIIKSVNP